MDTAIDFCRFFARLTLSWRGVTHRSLLIIGPPPSKTAATRPFSMVELSSKLSLFDISLPSNCKKVALLLLLPHFCALFVFVFSQKFSFQEEGLDEELNMFLCCGAMHKTCWAWMTKEGRKEGSQSFVYKCRRSCGNTYSSSDCRFSAKPFMDYLLDFSVKRNVSEIRLTGGSFNPSAVLSISV